MEDKNGKKIKIFNIIGTDEQRDDAGFHVRRYIAGVIKATSPNVALDRFLKANGLRRVDTTERGSFVCKTTYEAKEKKEDLR